MEAAVYAVPSEMTEDEIMASVRIVDGQKLSSKDLWGFLQDKLARFAIPRYIRFVDDFPRTETFRVKKGELKNLGITPDTFDAERPAQDA
jgi:carnitine-CoA ligase